MRMLGLLQHPVVNVVSSCSLGDPYLVSLYPVQYYLSVCSNHSRQSKMGLSLGSVMNKPFFISKSSQSSQIALMSFFFFFCLFKKRNAPRLSLDLLILLLILGANHFLDKLHRKGVIQL